MKCSVCGAELTGSESTCPGCGSPVDNVAEETAAQGGASSGEAVSDKLQGLADAVKDISSQGVSPQPATEAVPESESGPKKPKKKTGIIIGVAAAAVAAVGALAFGLMSREDPKEVVITAFENVYTDDQIKPMEELFGISQFGENAKTADLESSMTMLLDDCSEPSVKEFAGSGIRVVGKDDKTNKKSFASLGVIYKDMDLANLNVYYGDEALMMSLPELSSKVFTLDLSDGLEERIQESPILGPILASSDMNVEGLFDYIEEAREQMESGQTTTLDLEALMNRYKEGTHAQEKFKEALTVEKGEKGTFTIDGQEVSCKGYEVVVSKASMMEFLRTTTDFFLNDQELKDQYLKQLEQSVKLTELMGGQSAGLSADQLYLDSMEDVTEAVNEMIDYLDKSLTDMTMTVHVDKKGRLASVKGATTLNVEEDGKTEILQVDFDFKFQGGSYLTQNMTAEVVMENNGEHLTCSMIKQGTYDGKKLTGDLDLNMKLDGINGFEAGVTLTGTYDSESGDYHTGMAVTADNSMIVDISMTGVVDQLEKGTSFHMDIDELKVTVVDAMVRVTMSGEYAYGPLKEAVTALEGEEFDILAADENQWQSLFMEVYMGVMQLMSQLSM